MTIKAVLYRCKIESDELSLFHSCVLAVNNHAKSMKQSVADYLFTDIIVLLPFPVQNVGHTQSYTTKNNSKSNVTMVIVFIALLEVDTSFVSVSKTFSIEKNV